MDPFDQLEEMGLIGRWWCEQCKGKVPYRTLEMDEATSRSLHNADHHPE